MHDFVIGIVLGCIWSGLKWLLLGPKLRHARKAMNLLVNELMRDIWGEVRAEFAARYASRSRGRISSLAACTARFAVRLLPAADQPRYSEEFQAELYELAQTSRRAQWAHAVWLVCCAPRQRRELRLAAREAVESR